MASDFVARMCCTRHRAGVSGMPRPASPELSPIWCRRLGREMGLSIGESGHLGGHGAFLGSAEHIEALCSLGDKRGRRKHRS